MPKEEPAHPPAEHATVEGATTPASPYGAEATPVERRAESDPLGSRYERLDLLGEGGMGEVRLCTDRRIGRDVAVKWMRSELLGRKDLVARFLREAKVQARLEHPSIVPVYDLELGPGGMAFTMKRVRGVTLAEVIDLLRAKSQAASEIYTRRKLLGVLQQVCLALDFAHARGVVHRDLKPDNVMLGDFGEVYVLDWGIAKVDEGRALDADAPPDPTLAGSVLGTPGYMAPEQLVGGDVGPRTDVYALGLILFELLTLETLHAGSKSKIRQDTLRGVDATASRRSPHRDVPPELDAVCVRATAREPEGRFPSARAMHDAIERYLDGDRDLARRRELAAEHAEKAKQGLARMRAGGAAEDRATALREAGRAIVLDPTNEEALKVSLALRADPPSAVPEVEEQLAQSAGALSHVRMRFGLYVYGVMATMPLVVSAFYRADRTWIVSTTALLLVATAACAAYLRGRDDTRLIALALVASSGAIGMQAQTDIAAIPVLALVNGCLYFMSIRRGIRPLAVVACLSALLVPVLLQGAGVLDPVYRILPEGILVLHPALQEARSSPATASIGTCVVLTVLVAVAIGSIVERQWRTERALFLRTWSLRQVVPEAMQD